MNWIVHLIRSLSWSTEDFYSFYSFILCLPSLDKQTTYLHKVKVNILYLYELHILVFTVNSSLISDKWHHFLFPPHFFSPLSTLLIEGVLWSKNLFSESWWERPKTWGLAPFHFEFCRRCSIAGSEKVPWHH